MSGVAAVDITDVATVLRIRLQLYCIIQSRSTPAPHATIRNIRHPHTLNCLSIFFSIIYFQNVKHTQEHQKARSFVWKQRVTMLMSNASRPSVRRRASRRAVEIRTLRHNQLLRNHRAVLRFITPIFNEYSHVFDSKLQFQQKYSIKLV